MKKIEENEPWFFLDEMVQDGYVNTADGFFSVDYIKNNLSSIRKSCTKPVHEMYSELFDKIYYPDGTWIIDYRIKIDPLDTIDSKGRPLFNTFGNKMYLDYLKNKTQDTCEDDEWI